MIHQLSFQLSRVLNEDLSNPIMVRALQVVKVLTTSTATINRLAWWPSLARWFSGGHIISQGPGQLRGDNEYEEFLGGQSAGQRQRPIIMTRLNY